MSAGPVENSACTAVEIHMKIYNCILTCYRQLDMLIVG